MKKREEELAEMKSRHLGEVEAVQNDLAKVEAVQKYEEGFKYAKRQLRFLDPEFNLKALRAYKRFIDGELVGADDSDSDEFESETDGEEPPASDPAEPNPNSGRVDIIEEMDVQDPASPGVETQVPDGSTHAEEHSPVVQEANEDEPAD